MSPELRTLFHDHRQKLQRLLDDHREVFGRLERGGADLIEHGATPMALHSFYTGVEAIMRTVARAYDPPMPKSGDGHRALLTAMRRPTTRRPALLSDATAARLEEYLEFRHRVRNLYGFNLDWNLNAPSGHWV